MNSAASGREIRLEIVRRLGGCCTLCNFDDPRALQIDHRFGDGARHRKLQSGSAYYRSILADLWTGRYALLCANCNAIKAHEHGEFGRRKFDSDDLELTELFP